ncbi:MAG TPA: hypothetical protein PK156_26515 [Polyangium sp.]|nr:hypothetical protein [Polyangium sp.]
MVKTKFFQAFGVISSAMIWTVVGCSGGSDNGSTANGGSGNGSGGQTSAGGSAGQTGQTGSSSSGNGGQGGSINPTAVAMFIAQGHMGRTIVSCDDGQTWVANRSDDDAYPCFSDANHDCDHNPGAGRGITYGAGYFVATFGWGQPGAIRRSRNGTDWENTLVGKTFAGVVFGNDRFLAGERPPQFSTDNAGMWTPGGDPDSMVWNVRRTGFAPHDGGRFFLAFESGGTRDLNVSSDGGMTWKRPATLPAECAGDMQWSGGFAYGNGSALVLGGTGIACVSKDGGDTWTATNIGGTVDSRLLWDGSMFVTWGRADNGGGGTFPAQFTSADGVTWKSTAISVRTKNPDGTTQMNPGPDLGAVARSDAGTYVGVNGGWQQWYDKQKFYRSNDGVTWDALEVTKFVGGHPIQFIAFGMGERGGACP